MTWSEFRSKVDWLLKNHWLLTALVCILIAGPIRGLIVLFALWLIAK